MVIRPPNTTGTFTLAVPTPRDWIDAVVVASTMPIRSMAPAPRAATRPAAPASRAAAAPSGPTPPRPQPETPVPAAAPPLFSAAYGAEVYAKRLRRVLACRAEVAAVALADSRSRGRS